MYRASSSSALTPAPADSPIVLWLARAAPTRWFALNSGGFNVQRAPTTAGRVSFTLSIPSSGVAVYSVNLVASSSSFNKKQNTQVRWNLRWPGSVKECQAQAATIVSVEAATGIVSVDNGANMSFTAVSTQYLISYNCHFTLSFGDDFNLKRSDSIERIRHHVDKS